MSKALRHMIHGAIRRQRSTPRLSRRNRPNRRLLLEELENRQLLSASQPNFVFILTDDQDAETVQYMPQLQALLGEQGATFANAFVANPVCCPSNVSILTGQYSHNNQILHNLPPLGGFQKFVDMRTDGDPSTQGDENTLATWLQEAGYLTGRIGKYLVGYPEDSAYVPPGWDEWFSTYGGFPGYYNYGVNDNGNVIHFGDQPEDYSTDVLASRVVSFLDRAELNDEQPFFALFAPSTPHAQGARNGPPIPAPRHLGMFAGVQVPRTPSFNEADVSDKPPHVRNLPLLTAEQIEAIDREYQDRLESLQSVDEGIAQIVDALAARGELENTYVIFTSDNGYHLGHHRFFQGKGEVYEEDIRVPLLVRGPGVPADATFDHLALNIDFAPTIAELAGATAGRATDGRSLAALLTGDIPENTWRHDFLVEIYRVDPRLSGAAGVALRTRHELYVEYADGFRELYDLHSDPYQLQNVYATADPAHVEALSARLAELATCSGEDCRQNPPVVQVETVVVNDSSAQRSMVNSLTVTFNGIVSLEAGAFEVHDQQGSLMALSINSSLLNGRTVATLTFTGGGIIGGSLADGNYVLTIRSDRIHDLLGQQVDGNGDGFRGGDGTDAFFRLYGDADGDRDVDQVDRDLFRSAFNKLTDEDGYLWYFDFDGDGDVDGRDSGQFNRRFGQH